MDPGDQVSASFLISAVGIAAPCGINSGRRISIAPASRSSAISSNLAIFERGVLYHRCVNTIREVSRVPCLVTVIFR